MNIQNSIIEQLQTTLNELLIPDSITINASLLSTPTRKLFCEAAFDVEERIFVANDILRSLNFTNEQGEANIITVITELGFIVETREEFFTHSVTELDDFDYMIYLKEEAELVVDLARELIINDLRNFQYTLDFKESA